MSDAPDLNRVLESYDVRTKLRVSYMTNCPFHEDRTPSFSVNTDKGVWNCQSCGRKGNTIGLIMQKEECDYRRAADTLASLGITAGGTRGGGGSIRSRHLGSDRKASGGTRNRQGDGKYRSRWGREGPAPRT